MKQSGIQGWMATEQAQKMMSNAYYAAVGMGIIALIFTLNDVPGVGAMISVFMGSSALLLMLAAISPTPESQIGLSYGQAMFLQYLNGFSLALLIIGLLFKISLFPGSLIIVNISMLSLSLASALKGQFSLKGQSQGNIRLLISSFYFLQSIVIIGILFKIMHYPGSRVFTTLPVFLLVLYAYLAIAKDVKLINTASLRKAIILSFSFALFFGVTQKNSGIRSTQADFGKGPELQIKIKEYVSIGNECKERFPNNETAQIIDKEVVTLIGQIEDIKFAIMKSAQEETNDPVTGPVLFPYDKKFPMIPAELRYGYMAKRNDYDSPMRVLGISGYDDVDQNGVGMQKLWIPYVNFQNRLIELCGTYSRTSEILTKLRNGNIRPSGPNDFAIKITGKREMIEYKELSTILKNSTVNPNDINALTSITLGLALQKNYYDEYEADNKNWLSYNLNHAPMATVLRILTELELKIVRARFEALALLESRN